MGKGGARQARLDVCVSVRARRLVHVGEGGVAVQGREALAQEVSERRT